MLFGRSLGIDITAQTGVLTDNDLQWLTEMLGNLVSLHPTLTRVRIRKVGRLDGHAIPPCREVGTDDALSVERLRDDAKESLNERTAGDADTVAEVAIALATGSIVLTDLPEVGWRLAVVHLVEDVGLHQVVA